MGIAVHLLTASGAVFGILALHHAALHDWNACFAWLGLAFFVDGIDGPIARRVKASVTLPRFSGAKLDLIVDYMTYAIVPAFIVMEAGLPGRPWGAIAAGFILVTSLFHFSHRDSKTEDGFFVGFPAIWNVVCLYFFVLGSEPEAVVITIATLGAATIIPVKWPHPLRVRALRPVTLAVTAAWAGAAAASLLLGFPSAGPIRWIFIACAIYMIALGLARSFFTQVLTGRTK